MISKSTKRLPLTSMERPRYEEFRNDILRARPHGDARRLPLSSNERELMEYFHDGILRARPSMDQWNQLSPQTRELLHRVERARTDNLVQRLRQEEEEQQREAEAAAHVMISPEEREAQEEAWKLRCAALKAEMELKYPRRPLSTPELRVLRRGDRVTITNPTPGQVATAIVIVDGCREDRIKLMLDDGIERTGLPGRKVWRKRKNLFWNGHWYRPFVYQK